MRTSALSRNLLGTYLDPQFGLVNAGLVTQVRLSTNNVGSGWYDQPGCVAIRLVLSLAYDAANLRLRQPRPAGLPGLRA